MERRDFLKSAAATGVAAATGTTFALPPAPAATSRPEASGMIYRELGKTGERVSAIGLGGAHIGSQPTQEESVKLIRSAIDRGITFLDNCWDYNGGLSEVRMGQALGDGYRQHVFLMTKIDGRTKEEYNKQLEQSLGRLHTDVIDLVQFHEVIRMEDPDRIFAEGGAIEGAIAARQAGKIRYIGFTGHKDLQLTSECLKSPTRTASTSTRSRCPSTSWTRTFAPSPIRSCPLPSSRASGSLAMKTFGDKIILKSNTVQPIDMLHYGLSQPVSVVITGIDKPEILDQAIEAARTFKPLTQEQTASLLARTRDAASEGKFELFKTTPHFDGTAHNPQWLG